MAAALPRIGVLDPTAVSTFPDLLAELYRTRYTGPLTLHFQAGTAKVVDFPGPRLPLHGLDNPPPTSDAT